MAKNRNNSVCERCGHTESRWVGRCPACSGWGTMRERTSSPSSGAVAAEVGPLAAVSGDGAELRPTGIGELDRVLGGGLARGGASLVAGEPGIGKSTLLLQVARAAADRGDRVML